MGTTNFDKVATSGGVQAGDADLSEAELETIDTITPGTAVANKAAILGANKNLDVLALASLRLGAAAGTAVTATAAELNKLANSGAVVASGTQAAHVADLPAFTDPPSAAEMAALRTAVNSILAAQRAFGIRASS